MTGIIKSLCQQFATAALLMAAVATAGCQQLRYEPQLALRQLSRERAQPYYHSATTGEIVIKHPHRICPTAGPPYFGFEPTCWNPWPADWTGCPHPEFCDCPTSGASGPTPVDPPSPKAEPLPATPAEPPGNQDRTGSVLVPAPDAAAMVQPPRAVRDPTWNAPRIVAFTPQLVSDRRPANELDAQDLAPVPVHQAGAEVDSVDSARFWRKEAAETIERTEVVPADQDSHVDAANDGAADATDTEDAEPSSQAEPSESDGDQGPVVIIDDGEEIEAQDQGEDRLPADEADLAEADNGEITEDGLPAEDHDVAESCLNPEVGGTVEVEDDSLADSHREEVDVVEEAEGDEWTASVTTVPKAAETEVAPLAPSAADMGVTELPAPKPVAGPALTAEIATPAAPPQETAQQESQRPLALPATTLWSRSNPSVTTAGSGSLRFAGSEPFSTATPQETKAAIRFRSLASPQVNEAPSRISLRPSGAGPTTSIQLVR